MRGTTVGSISPAAHELADDRALEQVGAELREDAALRDVADVVARAPDALQAARDGLRRLDLQDEVDGAHVDAELERGRRDEARQLAGLQQLLDDEPLLARERAVVGARDVARSDALGQVGVGELVEAQRQPLGAAARVDEDDRRAVLLDELEDLGVDRRPDRAPRRLVARPGQRVERIDGAGPDVLLRLDHRLDRHVDLQVERLAHAGVDDRARPPRADHEAADLLERVLRRRQADPLRLAAVGLQRAEALEREREMRAALRRRDGVDLVDDHRLDAGQDLARAARQHQVQRLGRRDQDVGRLAPHRRAVALRRVAGAHADREVGADPAQRRAQVAVDVVGERLQRRDVDEARARALSAGCGSRLRRSSAHRNAASVLPEPVGAEISVCSPVAIAGQACAWTSVGPSNARLKPVPDGRGELRQRHALKASRVCGQRLSAISAGARQLAAPPDRARGRRSRRSSAPSACR